MKILRKILHVHNGTFREFQISKSMSTSFISVKIFVIITPCEFKRLEKLKKLIMLVIFIYFVNKRCVIELNWTIGKRKLFEKSEMCDFLFFFNSYFLLILFSEARKECVTKIEEFSAILNPFHITT